MSAAPSSADVFRAAAAAPVDQGVEGKVLPIHVMTRVLTSEFRDSWQRPEGERLRRVVLEVEVVHEVQEVRHINEFGDMQ